MKKVFVVDDHPMVIEGMRSMLQQLPDVQVCGYAMNAASCPGYFVANTADIMLLDINLPDQSGIEVCSALLKKNPGLKIIALSNFDQLTYLQGMKDAGAKGYLLKNASLAELEKAIKAVSSDHEYWIGKDSFRESIGNQNQLLLTRREIEVLKLIAEGLTNHEIAEKLFISDSTVDSHRKNLIAKLNVKNTAALIREVVVQFNDSFYF